MKHNDVDLEVGTGLRIHTGSADYIACTVTEKLSPSSYLIYVGHGCWEGILDPGMNALTPLNDSCGWMTQEQRMRKTIFNVHIEVTNIR